MLNFDALAAGESRDQPYRYMLATGTLTDEQAEAIRADYPKINKTGFLPLSRLDVHGAFAALVEDLKSDRLAEILSDKLGLDLVGKPRMITVRRLSKHGDGRVHNDSPSKICTMLVYLNADWDAGEGGAIRALNSSENMDDYAEEITPVAGNVFAFARSETSWHGHPSFAGERYVVQTTFLINEEVARRKENRGGIQLLLKKLNPFEGRV